MSRTPSNLAASPTAANPAAANIASACVEHPFEPRPTRFIGVREIMGWRLRTYTITLPGEQLEKEMFEAGLGQAAESLPQPAIGQGRFGVGFVIFHQGRGMSYIVLAWWSRENELPMHVSVRQRQLEAPWRSASGEESICVWDIEVLKRERDLFVRTVLAAAGPADVQRYLAAD